MPNLISNIKGGAMTECLSACKQGAEENIWTKKRSDRRLKKAP
jgi:hypothetical protein